MHSSSQYLFDIIILLSAAVFIVIAFWKMNISPVLGYFVAGALIGSHGFNLIHSADAMDNFAEFGVVFLLFIIGLELTFERLIAMRIHVFGFGSLQVIVTMIVIWCIALAFGVSANIAAVIGGGLALSSTAIVLQVLQEKGSQASQVGRLSIAVLLMQDFAVVPLIVLVPLLTGNSENSLISSLTGSLIQAAIALVLIFITGRLLLRPLFSVIAKMESNEVFVSTTLLIILGAAFITEQFHLSMALGAFVAGLLVAETEQHRHSVEHAVLPFKDLFLGLFFMTVGMSIDIDLLLKKLPLITLLSIILIVLKTSIIYMLCRFFGFKIAPAIQAGLLLAQGGEFAFILFRLADELNVLPSEIAQVLMMVTTVTMAFTPLLSGLGEWIANSFSVEKIILDDDAIETDTQDLYNHVIVVGFGRVGYMVTKMLTAEHLSYVVIDIQSKIVKKGKDDSFPIYLGDATRYEILKSIGIERAQALILSIKNEVTIKKIVSLVAINFPHVNIIIRLPDLANVEIYKDLGASKIIPEASEIGLQLGGAALSLTGISESGVESLKNRFRKGNYSMIKDTSGNIDE
ncbi:MAG: cation:proton antiporter [Wolbachia endosymbiont of Meromenopon meropis]|nr:cation:proton antiporter [Wolbachia endosymbiont of Meromenopon meropis]